MSKGVVLVADDDAAVRMVVNKALLRVGYDVRVTSNVSTLWQWIEAGEGDCVVCDVVMPDGEAFDVLPHIRQNRPDLPVILISAQNTFMTAIRAQEGGAFDYLPKPFDLNALMDTVERGVFQPKIDAFASRPATSSLEMPLVGRSAAMQEIFRQIARLRQSMLPVLLTGESGTGKTHIARVIHEFSEQDSTAFKSIDLTGMSETETEKALFGDDAHPVGILSSYGTVHINEILNLSLQLQARLLQVLKRRDELSHDRYQTMARLITTTSGDIHSAIAGKAFREDLFYRLGTIPVRVPALRERPGDIPDLVHHFLQRSDVTEGLRRHIEPEGVTLLRQANWPGNVLELENFLRRICLFYPHETITEKMVREQLSVLNDHSGEELETAAVSFASLAEATGHFTRNILDSDSGDRVETGLYHHLLGEFEQPVITAALNQCNGNQIRAAKLLGLNRNTLRKKIREYDIRIVKVVR